MSENYLRYSRLADGVLEVSRQVDDTPEAVAAALHNAGLLGGAEAVRVLEVLESRGESVRKK